MGKRAASDFSRFARKAHLRSTASAQLAGSHPKKAASQQGAEAGFDVLYDVVEIIPKEWTGSLYCDDRERVILGAQGQAAAVTSAGMLFLSISLPLLDGGRGAAVAGRRAKDGPRGCRSAGGWRQRWPSYN